jgi:hypothetical protein
MPIHEKKQCPNPIIISSNMGIGNLVKETASVRTLHQPPFAFPAPKEKRKCISASAQMQKKKTEKNLFYFFPSLSVPTRPASAWTQEKNNNNNNFFNKIFPRPHGVADGKKRFIYFFPITGPRGRGSRPHRQGARPHRRVGSSRTQRFTPVVTL